MYTTFLLKINLSVQYTSFIFCCIKHKWLFDSKLTIDKCKLFIASQDMTGTDDKIMNCVDTLTLSLPTKKVKGLSTSGDIARKQAVKLGWDCLYS